MKQLFSTLIVAILALAFAVGDAEARRLGGGRSFGVQRQSVAPSKSVQQAPPSQAAPTAPAAGPAAGAAPKPGWLGPIAGLAAGLGLGWLIGQNGYGGALLLIALMVLALVVVKRMLARTRTESDVQYAGAGGDPVAAAPPPLASGLNASPDFGAQLRPNVPPGFDTDGFLRQAKLNFVRLQAAHDSGRIEELREFTSDEMFASIAQEMQQQGALGQQTDVVTLNADLLEALTEGDTHWASVRFSGMMRETPEARPEPFQEVWNLAKPASGASGWVLAGIQQIQ
ncbi:MAG: Tim44 domain-containing protein [Burkholderiales bacterium]|nr:Tim44 domain-containing protein [Burkholderiales bacterium]